MELSAWCVKVPYPRVLNHPYGSLVVASCVINVYFSKRFSFRTSNPIKTKVIRLWKCRYSQIWYVSSFFNRSIIVLKLNHRLICEVIWEFLISINTKYIIKERSQTWTFKSFIRERSFVIKYRKYLKPDIISSIYQALRIYRRRISKWFHERIEWIIKSRIDCKK